MEVKKLDGQDQLRPDERVEVTEILSVSLELSCLGVPVGHDIEISDKEADMEDNEMQELINGM